MNNLIRLLAALLCTCMCIITTHAQISVESQSSQVDLRTQIDNALANLSMDPVTSGILLQRTIPLFDPDLRSTHSDGSAMSYNDHNLIYRNLYDARTLASSMLSPERAYSTEHDAYVDSDTVPMLLSAIYYHRMDSLAVADGRLTINGGQLYYGIGDPTSVYELDSIYSSGLFRTSVGRTLTLFLPNALIIGNLSIASDDIYIDAGDGLGYRRIDVNGYLNVTYPADGAYIIKIRYRSPNGSYTVHLHSVTVAEANGDTGSRGEEIDFTCPANCVCEDIYSLDGETGINVSYRLSCRDADGSRSRDINQIKRPLIILDGINLFWEGNAMNMDSLLSDERRGMRYRNTLVLDGLRLGDILDNNDYDLIFVDYHDHHTGIEKNAAAFQQLLRKINRIKAANGSPYENIVMGVSMGGVVSTFALRDMELKGEDHDVSDFITFDSPIQGANIPVALQGLVLNANNLIRDIKWLGLVDIGRDIVGTDFIYGIEKVLGSPSPRQMLLYNIFDPTGNTHHNFYSLLEQMGPVQNAKTLAISNGSSAAATDIGPSSLIFKVNGVEPTSGDHSDNFWLDVLYYFARWTGIVKVDVNMEAYTAPGKPNWFGNKNLLYEGRLGISILFGLVGGYDYTKVTTNNSMRPIDSAPGGSIGTGAIGGLIDPADLSGWGVDLRLQNFCFIPTVSALDIQPVGADLMHTNLLTTNFTSTSYDAISTQVGPAPVVDGNGNQRVDGNGNPITTNNNGHVTMNFDNITALLGVAEIEGERLGNVLEGRTYNFGSSSASDISQVGSYRPTSTGQFITRNLMVRNGGNLWINNDARIGFVDNVNNRNNAKPTTFEVSLEQDVCSGFVNTLEINAGGTCLIGNTSAQNIGSLRLKEYNKMIIQNGGVVTLNEKSSIILEKGSKLIVGSGGILNIENNAFVNVLEDGNLILETGSILNIRSNGYIDVDHKGVIEVSQGARIIATHPSPDAFTYGNHTDRGSRIDLDGILVMKDGVMAIEGSGYLRFNLNAKCWSSTDKMTFIGHGKKHVSYRVDRKLDLVLHNVSTQDAYFYLNNDVTLDGNGSKSFTSTNSVFENKSYAVENSGTIYSNEKYNLTLNNVKTANLTSTDFRDVICIIDGAQNVAGNTVTAVSYNKKKLFELSNVNKATFNRSTFTTKDPVYNIFGIITTTTALIKLGFDLFKVGELRLNQSELSGFNLENGRTGGQPVNDYIGIRVKESPYIYMRGSKILNCFYGIKAEDAFNLTMIDSELGGAKNSTGIEMRGTATTGLVKMVCSSIHDCDTGISGTDITLAIDGLINSQATKTISANSFLNNGFHFSINYNLKDYQETIYARYNNWTNPKVYRLSYGSSNLSIPLDQSFSGRGLCQGLNSDDCNAAAPGFPIVNANVPPLLYKEFCPGATTCTGDVIMERYWRGYNCLFNDNLQGAVDALLPLGLDHYGADNADMRLYCQAMLAEANAFAGGMYEYDDNKGAFGLDLDVTCGDIIDGVQTKVVAISTPNASNLTAQKVVWNATAPGVIYGPSNTASIVTNGIGTYSVNVMSTTGCKYTESIGIDSLILDCDSLSTPLDTIVFLTGPDYDDWQVTDSIVAHVVSQSQINPDQYVWEVHTNSGEGDDQGWIYNTTTTDSIIVDTVIWNNSFDPSTGAFWGCNIDSIKVFIYKGTAFIGSASKVFGLACIKPILDNNGDSQSLSEIENRIKKPMSATIQPNPFIQDFDIIWYSETKSSGQISILDNLGRSVHNQDITLSQGENRLNIDNIDKLSNGIYMIQLNSNGNVKTLRAIKTN